MPRENIAGRTVRYEALHAKLETLLTQVAAVAKSKPGEAVAPIVLALAGDLLFEAREFRPRGERRGLPGVAPDHAGLAVQLGQALAMLDLWARREAVALASAPPAEPAEDMDALRKKLALRIERHNAGIFEAGRRAGLAEKALSDQSVEKSYPRAGGTR